VKLSKAVLIELSQLRSPASFKPAAVQFIPSSATFPKVMGLMLGMTPMSENHMMRSMLKRNAGGVVVDRLTRVKGKSEEVG